ncbi:MAG: PDC sensor domain-containing protein, partial [Marinobacterium sp.]|nr:PDC sensor domain-containing protein [Marinobacterium sp.]
MNVDVLRTRRTAKGAIQPHSAVALFTLFVVIACFITMIFVIEHGEQRAIHEQEARTQLLAHTIESTVIRSVEDILSQLRSVESAVQINPSLLTTNTDKLQSLLKNQLYYTPVLRGITLYSTHGRWITSSHEQP